MSPVNSNSSERDFDAIHRAQRAHEPSMEEILASIRNIIADDPAKAAATEAPQPAPAPIPPIVSPEQASAPLGDTSGSSPMRPETNAPAVVWRGPQAVEGEPAGARRPREEPLLSPEATEAAALSFGALSAGLEARSAELADGMVRDMLRPMLKSWLDDNLPPIVERLVREEIQRVARGSR